MQVREQLAAGPEAYTATGYVLVDELGARQRTDWLRRRFKKLTAAAGVRPVKLYDTRHATLTYLAVNGVPAPIVSAWAGHSDLSMAQRVCVHPGRGSAPGQRGADQAAGLIFSERDQLKSVRFCEISVPGSSPGGSVGGR